MIDSVWPAAKKCQFLQQVLLLLLQVLDSGDLEKTSFSAGATCTGADVVQLKFVQKYGNAFVIAIAKEHQIKLGTAKPGKADNREVLGKRELYFVKEERQWVLEKMLGHSSSSEKYAVRIECRGRVTYM